MGNKEAGALLIKNLCMLEDVATLHNETIGPDICSEINSIIKKFASHHDFNSEFNLWDDKIIWFSLKKWRLGGNDSDEDLAGFYLCFAANGKEIDFDKSDYNFFLSPFFGIGPVQAGFQFCLDINYLNNVKKSEWNKFCLDSPHILPLRASGFIPLKDGNLFLPFKLNSDLVSNAYINETLSDALEPIENALTVIENALPHFVGFVESGKAKYGLSEP